MSLLYDMAQCHQWCHCAMFWISDSVPCFRAVTSLVSLIHNMTQWHQWCHCAMLWISDSVPCFRAVTSLVSLIHNMTQCHQWCHCSITWRSDIRFVTITGVINGISTLNVSSKLAKYRIKPEELYILRCEKSGGRIPVAFSTAKNGELRGF